MFEAVWILSEHPAETPQLPAHQDGSDGQSEGGGEGRSYSAVSGCNGQCAAGWRVWKGTMAVLLC